MLHSYFVEYRVFRAHPVGSYYTPDRPCKSIIGFVDILTSQNLEAFKKVVLKKYGEKNHITLDMDKSNIDIINISYLGGK